MLILPFNTAFAGDDDENKIGGIRAGWQYSALYNNGNIVEDSDPLSSFYVGLFRENKLIPLLAIGTGIEYFQVGIVDKENSNTNLRLHYISIPIDLRVKLGPVYALGGLGLNFRVAEKWKVDGESFDPSDEVKSEVFDMPLFLGVGVKIAIIRIEARYHWGMFDVYKPTDLVNEQNSQYLQVGLGVSF